VGKASSTKKVARLAGTSSKTKVRTSRSLTFPIIVVVVVALGLALVAFARTSSTASADTPPTLSDHWHAAYGIYVCDQWLTSIQNQNDSVDGVPWGIHTHGDGVIHIHPFNSAAAGKNADLGQFFKTAGIKMSDTKLELPEGLGTFEEGNDTPVGDPSKPAGKCGDQPGSLKVLMWDNANSSADPKVFITDFNNIRFVNDRMAFTIAFVPDDADLSSLKPPSVPTLDELTDVVDSDVTTGADGSNAPTTVGAAGSSETTVAGGAATTAGAAGSSATTVAATTAAPTTSG
jgi:hypothetical protein